MITIGSNGQKIAYGIKHYNLDTEADLQNMPRSKKMMGCTCFIIETSKYYMLNSNQKWVEITPFGKIMFDGGEDGGDFDDPDIPIPDKDIIYEGSTDTYRCSTCKVLR